MDPKIRSSFIPKKSIITKSSKPKRHSSFNVLTFVSTIAFIGALVVSIGAFAYMRIIEGNINQKGIELESARQSIEPQLIEEFKELDNRLRVAKELLDRHVAVTTFFEFLEVSTLQSVKYGDFRYILNLDNSITIDLSGTAKSYNSLALQSNLFKESGIIQNAIFSGLTLDDFGNVNFFVTASVDRSLVSYQKKFDTSTGFEEF